MVALTQEEKRVVELFQRLPAERRPYVMLLMAGADADGWKRHQKEGAERLRALASGRGIDWDRLTEDEREDFVAALLDESPA
jgi:hypothetical protein